MIDFEVRPGEAGQRLDRFLVQRLPHLSRGEAVRLISAGEVRLDGGPVNKGTRLRAGQMVSLPGDATLETPIPQPDLALDLLAELPGLVAINKTAGAPCHPLRPGERGTVANALLARYPECAHASPTAREAGLVHRLDRPTSGVLLAARDRAAYLRLRGWFSSRKVSKEYIALVEGELREEREVTASVRPAAGDPSRVEAVDEFLPDPAHEACSRITPLEQLTGYTLVKVASSTGRRHQVLIHLRHLDHPLAGDELYGGHPVPDPGAAEGAMLHASRVLLPEGAGDFSAPLPWEALLAQLRSR